MSKFPFNSSVFSRLSDVSRAISERSLLLRDKVRNSDNPVKADTFLRRLLPNDSVSNCVKPESGVTSARLLFSRESVWSSANAPSDATSEIRLLFRESVVNLDNPARGAISERVFLLSHKAVRLEACSKPVKSLMSALFTVSVVNFNISDTMRLLFGDLSSADVIAARSAASETVTGALSSTPVAVNHTGCETSAATTRTVVIPAARPNVKRAAARPVASVLTV